jgi:hypothetical protein
VTLLAERLLVFQHRTVLHVLVNQYIPYKEGEQELEERHLCLTETVNIEDMECTYEAEYFEIYKPILFRGRLTL